MGNHALAVAVLFTVVLALSAPAALAQQAVRVTGGGAAQGAGMAATFELQAFASSDGVAGGHFVVHFVLPPEGEKPPALMRIQGGVDAVVPWNFPDVLSGISLLSDSARVRVHVRDQSGNVSTVASGQFEIRKPPSSVPTLRFILQSDLIDGLPGDTTGRGDAQWISPDLSLTLGRIEITPVGAPRL